MTLNKFHITCVLLLAALLLPGCRKKNQPAPEENGIAMSKLPVRFATPSVETKAPLHTSMGPNYNTSEDFMAYAAYSPNPFTPAVPASFVEFWTGGLRCTYNSAYGSTLGAWAPTEDYFFPLVGYLSFMAYSPADGTAPASFSWEHGFIWNDFTVEDAGSQYDLLYSDLTADCQRSDYTIKDAEGYDDDSDYTGYAYNGIDLSFHHALSLIEVQAVSALGSYSTVKYYVQSVVLHNAYDTGDFASETEEWTDIKHMVDYTLLDLSGEALEADKWKKLPGSDQYPVSLHPDNTLLLLPQELDRDGDPSTITLGSDAYLEVVYKCGNDAPQTAKVALTGEWEKGKRYTYRLVFSAYIEFVAEISAWDDDITYGNTTIIH